MKINENLYDRISTLLPKCEVKFIEPIRNHTYTKLGGSTDVFVLPSSYDDIQTLLQWVKEKHIPLTLLGSGANLIVKDGGIRGITMCLKKINHIRTDNGSVFAEAGASIIDVSMHALACELTGLEFACGIPGTVGGALFMNAGAYGGQIADVLVKALVMTEEGELVTLSNEDLCFGYRKSIISKNNYIVLETEFKLQSSDYDTIKAKIDELTWARESKQPLEYPSCGSVFKRPPGYFAGKLIQDSGLQGKRIGGAEVSNKHAGFIVNVDHATSKDYIELIELIQQTVKQKFDVDLETEVIIIGEEK